MASPLQQHIVELDPTLVTWLELSGGLRGLKPPELSNMYGRGGLCLLTDANPERCSLKAPIADVGERLKQGYIDTVHWRGDKMPPARA